MCEKNVMLSCHNEEVKSEVLRIANKLRGFKLSECCKLINDYLKETVMALDFTDEKATYSTIYDALILKKSDSYGYISAFEAILKELGVKEEIFSPIKYVFNYNGKEYIFECLTISYVEGGSNKDIDLFFSPYTEKLCNRHFLNHNVWFRAYTHEL